MAFSTIDGMASGNTRRPSGLGNQQKKPAGPRGTPPARRPNPPPPSAPPMMGAGSVPNVTAAAPRPPGISGYLAGDDVYQQALRGGKRTLRDFLSELTRRRGEAKTSFGQTSQQMETDRTRRLEEIKNEFASRGLLQSGIYAEEQGRFQQDFSRQMEQLTTANKQLLSDILGQETNFRREQELALELARQEALARRASRYNIGV